MALILWVKQRLNLIDYCLQPKFSVSNIVVNNDQHDRTTMARFIILEYYCLYWNGCVVIGAT